MNYLAHLLLTEHTPDGFVGALLGDRIKGRIDPALAPALRDAVILHRRIDSFTDAHPVHLRSRRRFRPPRRRFAGIIVDVAYDHFLARAWARHGEDTLERFAARVYAALGANEPLQPPALREMTRRMAAGDWLVSYRLHDSMGRALDAIARRARRGADLVGAGAEVEACYEALAADFDAFFPDLVRHAAALRARAGTLPGPG